MNIFERINCMIEIKDSFEIPILHICNNVSTQNIIIWSISFLCRSQHLLNECKNWIKLEIGKYFRQETKWKMVTSTKCISEKQIYLISYWICLNCTLFYNYDLHSKSSSYWFLLKSSDLPFKARMSVSCVSYWWCGAISEHQR